MYHHYSQLNPVSDYRREQLLREAEHERLVKRLSPQPRSSANCDRPAGLSVRWPRLANQTA